MRNTSGWFGDTSSRDEDEYPKYCHNCEEGCYSTYEVYRSERSSNYWCECCRRIVDVAI
jgi:hypothetical protein